MLNVYTLKNNLTGSYSNPTYNSAGPDDVFRQTHNFLLLYPEKAVEQFLNISTIFCIGTFDDSNGLMEILPQEQWKSYNLQDSWDQIKSLEVIKHA